MFILISIAIHKDLEIMKVNVTSAYVNTPMNDGIKHKWLMLDKDVASVLPDVNGCKLLEGIPTQGREDFSQTRQNYLWFQRSCLLVKCNFGEGLLS